MCVSLSFAIADTKFVAQVSNENGKLITFHIKTDTLSSPPDGYKARELNLSWVDSMEQSLEVCSLHL